MESHSITHRMIHSNNTDFHLTVSTLPFQCIHVMYMYMYMYVQCAKQSQPYSKYVILSRPKLTCREKCTPVFQIVSNRGTFRHFKRDLKWFAFTDVSIKMEDSSIGLFVVYHVYKSIPFAFLCICVFYDPHT